MKISFLILSVVLLLFGCQSNTTENVNTESTKVEIQEPLVNTSEDTKNTIGVFKDKVSDDEKERFERLAKSEDILFTQNVNRYFTIENGDTLVFENEILYQKTNGLIEDMYSSYTLSYNGELDNMTIEYDYVAGLADISRGTIIVMGDSYIHTRRGCGTTTCCTTLRKDGEQVYEKCE